MSRKKRLKKNANRKPINNGVAMQFKDDDLNQIKKKIIQTR